MYATAVTSPATTPECEGEPIRLQKRIGSTVYTANAFFSNQTSETLGDKILRLARNNGLDFQSENADLTRTGRPQERKAV
jgi:hypothetical protein